MESIDSFFSNLFGSNDFMPRWVCGNWTSFHGWLYIISNFLIWASYFTIPLLLYYIIKKHKSFIFKPVVIWFILFIFFCGTTHLLDLIIFWIPIYRVNAVVLFLTAFVSWVTVYKLYKHLPVFLEYKSPEDLQSIIDSQTKKLEEAYLKLAESENQFKTLVNSNPDVITRIGNDLKYKYINDSILRMRQLKIDDIVGKSLYQLNNPKDSANNEKFIQNVIQVFQTGQSKKFEFSTFTNTSDKSYFEMNIIPLKLEGNEDFKDVLTITKDITTQKLNEISQNQNIENLEMLAKKLENKRKILEDFTYIVSHNLRSPVANLSSLFNIISEEKRIEVKEMLFGKLFEAFNKLSETVSDLTKVVQIRQNTEVEKQLLSFEEITKNIIISLETQIIHAEADIQYDFGECPKIEYPKIYLESILLNLLTNTIKYRSPERKLKVMLKTSVDKNGIIVFTCQDNGLGIDLQKHGHKIFGLNKTFHEHPDSKGVGLFITKNQIETLGGTISVESSINESTKFIIQFNSYINQWTEK